MAGDQSVSITDTDNGSSGFELTTNLGNRLSVFSVDLQPDQTFSLPVEITFTWSDTDNNGREDLTNAKEANLLISQDNVEITGKCRDEPVGGDLPDCDMVNNTFKVAVSEWSEFVLAYDGDPQVMGITVPDAPVSIDAQPVNLSGSFYDADDNDDHSAIWKWGDEEETVGAVQQASDTVTGSHSYTEPGVYTAELTVTDGDGYSGNLTSDYIVIYDPEGGFVTGGGWDDSPPEAYRPNPSLTGRANFGVVSKYRRTGTQPVGSTEFQFHAGDLNFHSDSYEWLVVNGNGTAMFKGAGTINGESHPSAGLYKFMIWAGDGDPDTFRIKIWYEEGDQEFIVYDNGTDQDIGGGSIVVHIR